MLKAIIFDVDGVLLDSFESNVKYLNELFTKFGYPKLTNNDYSTMFHLPSYDVIKEWTKSDDEGRIKEIIAYGDRLPMDNNVEMPSGAREALYFLNKKYRLGIVTGRQRDNIFEGKLSECKNLFDASVGYEDTATHKPSPEPLLLVAKRLNVKPRDCVYIGDAITDVEAGNAAGIKVISYGKENLKGSVAHATSFKEITDAIKTIKY
ncbi:MAG TPA: HAD family hydrolase [Candidatus Nanoarchaeia archaeon]|nr:HAD family hydrolase [Candidatus Nanoarchaeia archaeon]